jgi:hypothetical protein
MTQKELENVCILLRIPKSGNAALDALISEARREDLAKTALVGILSNTRRSFPNDVDTQDAVAAADALIETLKK